MYFMDNFYYLFFYKLCIFFKWINRRQKDIYRFSSYIFITLCESLNVLSFLVYLQSKIHFTLSTITTYEMCIPLLLLNYFILMANGKDKKIFNYYEERYFEKSNNSISSIIVFTYAFLSISITFFA